MTPLSSSLKKEETWGVSLENIRTQLGLEIESIDRLLFESYTELFAQVQSKDPNLIEMTTLACVLHSFYNGVENICLSIAQVLDKEVPAGADWHRKLLDQMTAETANRKPLISAEMVSQLDGYLSFRHFFRHAYCDRLKWDKMKEPVLLVVDAWNQFKAKVGAKHSSLKPANDMPLMSECFAPTLPS